MIVVAISEIIFPKRDNSYQIITIRYSFLTFPNSLTKQNMYVQILDFLKAREWRAKSVEISKQNLYQTCEIQRYFLQYVNLSK